MRVAILTTSYPLWPGQAAGHFVEREACALRRKGHEVWVIAPGPRTEQTRGDVPVQRLRALGAFGPPGVIHRLTENPARLLGVASFVWLARRALRRLEPVDVLVAHWLLPCAWPIGGAVGGETTQLEVVLHGSDVELLCRLPRLLRSRIVRTLERRGARFRFVSEALRAELQGALGRRILRSEVRACEPNVEDAPSQTTARDRLGIPRDGRLALIVARLVPSKRVECALQVLCRMKDVQVAVVGDGPLLASLHRRFPGVRFTGQLAHGECLLWIAAASVLVSTSSREGAPMTIREARKLGTPVVCAPAGDCAQLAAADPGIWLSSRPPLGALP